MKLPHKTVFLTEGDSPSGRALLRRLADEGAQIIVNSMPGREALEAELSYCQQKGSLVLVTSLDLCHSQSLNAMLEQASGQLGPVDVLIHNNNRFEPASVEASDEALFHRIMNENAKSALLCAQSVGRQMAARRTGKIIFVSSIHAEKPTGASFAYSLSRSAVKMLSKELALELGRYGINVNTIELGPLEGESDKFQSPLSTLYEDVQYKVPSTVLGTYEDLAEAVLYLASEASRYVNGADLRLDGGFLLHYMNHKMNKPASG